MATNFKKKESVESVKVVKKTNAGEEVLIDTTEHNEVEGFIPSHRLANVGMTAGFTHALPKYSNVKATVSLFMPCDIEDVDDTFGLVREWVTAKLDEVHTEYTSEEE